MPECPQKALAEGIVHRSARLKPREGLENNAAFDVCRLNNNKEEPLRVYVGNITYSNAQRYVGPVPDAEKDDAAKTILESAQVGLGYHPVALQSVETSSTRFTFSIRAGPGFIFLNFNAREPGMVGHLGETFRTIVRSALEGAAAQSKNRVGFTIRDEQERVIMDMTIQSGRL